MKIFVAILLVGAVPVFAQAQKPWVSEGDAEEVATIISGGEYSNPVRVVAFNTAEGWSRDVTEDISEGS